MAEKTLEELYVEFARIRNEILERVEPGEREKELMHLLSIADYSGASPIRSNEPKYLFQITDDL